MKVEKLRLFVFPIVLIYILLLLPVYLSESATATIDVLNVAPTINVGSVQLIDWGSVDDNDIGDGMTGHQYGFRVGCNFTVTDLNGINDIQVARANLTKKGTGIYAANDEDVHFENNSCTLNYSSGITELVFSCLFKIHYYTDNGTWICHASVNDSSNERDNATDSALLQAITSLEANASYGTNNDLMQFGTLSVGGNSSTPSSIVMINIGNTELDILISGTNMSNITNRHNFSVKNITFNRSVYWETKKGNDTADPNANPRQLQENDYVWDLNIPDRESEDNDFIKANETALFRIIIPAGQTPALYENTITINGQVA